MKRAYHKHIVWLFAASIILVIASCSTQKNTSGSRWWHSFNARYNTYYNGTLAYIDGSLEKEQGNKDNFTEMIPLYTVGNKDSKELGKANFDKAIEKCEKAIHQHSIKRRPVWDKSRRKTPKDIEWLNRKEYNPFLWKAWLLMGRSQFYQGDFESAASTFSYMSRLYETQPAIYGKARAWLAKCYIENDWMYDAEDVIRNMERDSIHWRARKEWDYTYADYYIHSGNFEKAIPYLRKVIKHEMRRKQKAREWYLMGQLQAALGHKEEAYKSFRSVVRQNPPYELAFNARISMSEVMAGGNPKKMIGKLKRMAASDNNKDYLDQVYYAIGNIYLLQKDTANAISAYEKGNEKATRSGIEKGVLLLHLGDLYWAKEKFSDARRCYGEAIGLLDKDRKDYEQLSERSKVLDKLVPYTDAVHLQDSLQSLAKMNEKDRNEAIDRVIDALKKKEKEERNKAAEGDVANMQINNAANNTSRTNRSLGTSSSMTRNGQWYFYNQTAVTQGKNTFQRQWGKRENVDDWQRINKTVVANAGGIEEMTDQERDSLAQEAERQDSLKQIADSAQNDPHKRDYYLAQIPFSDDQVQESNKIIEDGLYNSGVIFKDKLDNLSLSEKALRRLVDYYPDYENLDQAYYHLFLLYSRKGLPATASVYLQKLKSNYPKSQYTLILTDPYFAENAKFGVHIEDSLYASTYNAFKADRYNEVAANTRISKERFPMGANRDKFIFINGLSKLNKGDANGCIADMKEVVEKYPNSRISELAGMIVNGVNAGRRLHGGKFDIGDIWALRSEVLNDSDSLKQQKFSTERNTNFVFMIVYKPDSVNENQLLFNLARFNFTTYLVRDFDINIDEQNGLHRMSVAGFRSYDEALQYAHQFYQQANIIRLLGKGRTIIISETNLAMLGITFSYNDYDKFYAKHFAPLKVSTFHLLTEPTEVTTEKEPEPTQEEIDRTLDSNMIDNGLEIESIENDNNTVPANGTIVVNEEDNPASQNEGTTVVTEPEQPATTTPPQENRSVEVVPEPVKPTPTPTVPTKKPTVNPKKKPATSTEKKTTTSPVKKPVQEKKPVIQTQPQLPQKEDTGIYFDDGFGSENNNRQQDNNKDNNKDQKKDNNNFDLEDEYYDLEGF